ncbi:hypothetical protein HK098_003864 [Nowakowskiella sp. JEL0407]|nr:hypothetical protein HK098_003864 [Nowakowskiella sp. JEL0407]
MGPNSKFKETTHDHSTGSDNRYNSLVPRRIRFSQYAIYSFCVSLLFVFFLHRQCNSIHNHLFSPIFNVNYPYVRRSAPVIDNYFGENVTDFYRWLEDPFSEETIEFANSQNNLAKRYISSLPQYHAFKKKYRELVQFDTFGSPIYRNNMWYYFANLKGQNPQPILYRTSSLNESISESEVFFNPNLLVKDGIDLVDAISFSEDGTKFAYEMTKNETDYAIIGFLDAHNGSQIDYSLKYAIRSLEDDAFQWANDGSGVVYIRFKKPPNLSFVDAGRNNDLFPYRLERVYHKWGVHPDLDIVCEEDDDEYNMMKKKKEKQPKIKNICDEKTDSSQTILSSDRTVKLQLTDQFVTLRLPKVKRTPMTPSSRLDFPEFESVSSFSQTEKEEEDTYFTKFVGRNEERKVTYYSTAAGANNYHVIGVQDDSNVAYPVIEEDPKLILDVTYAIDNNTFLALFLDDVKHVMRILQIQPNNNLSRSDNTELLYQFPLENGVASDVKVDSKNKIACFVYSNLINPGTVYVYNLTENRLLVFRKITLDHLKRNWWGGKHPVWSVNYEQVFFNSTKNANVSAFILKYNGTDVKKGPSPAWLNAYGGFNIAMLPRFNPFALALATYFRPSAYILVNIRGGSEYGRDWYLSGRNLEKQNCFDDMRSACKFLIEKGFTVAGKCGINGGSNGGLLAAAVTIQSGDLYGVSLADYGVHDTLRYTNFTFGPGWQNDYGHKENGTEVLSVRKWAPIYNINPKTKYPAILITTGDHDTRVSPLHSYKLAAEMQFASGTKAAADGDELNKVFLRVREVSGHNIFSLERKVDAFSEKVSFWADRLEAILR